jgi:two-component system, response regulator PdtaR
LLKAETDGFVGAVPTRYVNEALIPASLRIPLAKPKIAGERPEHSCQAAIGINRAGSTIPTETWAEVTTVLVVEDEFLVMMAITADLIAEGYDVLSASNADQAIKILESRNDIETVFTDIEMPGSMDGLKLAQAVRHRWPPVNIVVTSGKKRPGDNEMPKNSGFVPKPYGIKDVLNAFRAFF